MQDLSQRIHILHEDLPETEDVPWLRMTLFLGNLREKKFFDP